MTTSNVIQLNLPKTATQWLNEIIRDALQSDDVLKLTNGFSVRNDDNVLLMGVAFGFITCEDIDLSYWQNDIMQCGYFMASMSTAMDCDDLVLIADVLSEVTEEIKQQASLNLKGSLYDDEEGVYSLICDYDSAHYFVISFMYAED